MTPNWYLLTPVPFTEEYRPDLLGGVIVIQGKGYAERLAGGTLPGRSPN